MPKPFGQMIRLARNARGMTLEELAQQVGVTAGALSHIEGGKRLPSPVNAVAIADALGMDVEGLLRELDEAHSSRRRDSLGSPAASASDRGGARNSAAYRAMPIDELFGITAGSGQSLGSLQSSIADPHEGRTMRQTARYSNDTDRRLEALDRLADGAADAIRTLRGMLDDEDPAISREARRLLRELDVRLPEE